MGEKGKQVESLRGPATVAGEPASRAPIGAPLGMSPGKVGGEAMTREPGNLP